MKITLKDFYGKGKDLECDVLAGFHLQHFPGVVQFLVQSPEGECPAIYVEKPARYTQTFSSWGQTYIDRLLATTPGFTFPYGAVHYRRVQPEFFPHFMREGISLLRVDEIHPGERKT